MLGQFALRGVLSLLSGSRLSFTLRSVLALLCELLRLFPLVRLRPFMHLVRHHLVQHSPNRKLMDEALQLAMREALFCETVLAKGRQNIVLETLRDAPNVETWAHYPPGDIYDPESGGQWYYHCHDTSVELGEHGHFHCFLRPQGSGGAIHHLIAIGVDPYGRLVRLFTVNRWVVGDDWTPAEDVIALLPRFDIQMPRPSYLVNRWLSAILRVYAPEIEQLIRQRDVTVAAHRQIQGTAVFEDRSLEVTSELRTDLLAKATQLGGV